MVLQAALGTKGGPGNIDNRQKLKRDGGDIHAEDYSPIGRSVPLPVPSWLHIVRRRPISTPPVRVGRTERLQLVPVSSAKFLLLLLSVIPERRKNAGSSSTLCSADEYTSSPGVF